MAVKVPINTELYHLAPGYDPQQAHDYYMRTRHLKGRQKGQAPPTGAVGARRGKRPHPAKHQQKIALKNSIQKLENQLKKLEELIHKKEAALHRNQVQKKSKARKKKDTPKTAADKAKATRESKKYRQKHRQTLKNKAKQAAGKSGGGKAGAGAKKPKDMSVADLKALATKVKGQIAVAKQKLAAL